MKLSDLEDTMIVETRNGIRYFVCGDKFVRDDLKLEKSDYNEELNSKNILFSSGESVEYSDIIHDMNSDLDIVKIYTINIELLNSIYPLQISKENIGLIIGLHCNCMPNALNKYLDDDKILNLIYIRTDTEQEKEKIENSNIEYPKLFKSNLDYYDVLFTDLTTGTVVYSKTPKFKTGMFSNRWAPHTDEEKWIEVLSASVACPKLNKRMDTFMSILPKILFAIFIAILIPYGIYYVFKPINTVPKCNDPETINAIKAAFVGSDVTPSNFRDFKTLPSKDENRSECSVLIKASFDPLTSVDAVFTYSTRYADKDYVLIYPHDLQLSKK